MTKEIKVSYLTRWDNSGTVYKKAFNINEKILEAFHDVLDCEVVMLENKLKKELSLDSDDYSKKLYLSQRLTREGDIVFLNLTQRNLFIDWILRLGDVEVNKKRAFAQEHNTCLIIK